MSPLGGDGSRPRTGEVAQLGSVEAVTLVPPVPSGEVGWFLAPMTIKISAPRVENYFVIGLGNLPVVRRIGLAC